MEDMARLALVEQNVRDTEKFTKLLCELLRLINLILENPHDYELRIVESNLLKNHLINESLVDYLKYIGFQTANDKVAYPKEQPLSKLRIAQAAIERKIGFCSGETSLDQVEARPSLVQVQAKRPKLVPENVLQTENPFLLKIESSFNNMLRYEDESLQAEARAHIPVVTLQLLALDRMREHQRQIKDGETKTPDLPFDIALLMELLGWFKEKFFKWVDKPECKLCGGATSFVGSTAMTTPTETCKVELYQCTVCPNGRTEFPRYNEPRTLLRTRRGRCGEWANCFTLLCRALGYDTRYVYSTTDHVWCEVYDYDSCAWLHADPCETKLDAPLLYSHGWGKELQYVVAVSRDDLQDVTWRYTTNHKEVLKRRTLCSERELVDAIVELRWRRQRQLAEPRRRYLARRTVHELAQLMVERTAKEDECAGRISGSMAWRRSRGEAGAAGFEFRFSSPGDVRVSYCCAADRYCVSTRSGDQWLEQESLQTWQAGAYAAKDVFRKVETDWQKVYIAREEGAETGWITWRLSSGEACAFSRLRLRAEADTFRGGAVRWSLRLDDHPSQDVRLAEGPLELEQRFKSVEIRADLSGGAGHTAWQHAQLFRQSLTPAAPASSATSANPGLSPGDDDAPFEIRATLVCEH